MGSRGLMWASAFVGFAAIGGTSSSSATNGRPEPIVSTRPTVVRLNQQAIVIVRGYVPSRGLQVRLAGATDSQNVPATWIPLQHRGIVWTGPLPQPKLRGIYLIQLRAGPADPIIQSPGWLFRVFAVGTLARPSFTTPQEVIHWWVRSVAHATVAALKRWQTVTWDHRDNRLHQVFVVAYSPPGDPAINDRLGMFVTAVRNGFHGRWRFLEAAIVP